MSRKRWEYLASLTGILLSGCAAEYVQPGSDRDHAVIEAHPSPDFNRDTSIHFHGYSTETCRHKAGEGELTSFWGYEKKKEKPIQVRVYTGKRLYVRAQTKLAIESTSTFGGGITIRYKYCNNVISFVPESQRKYVIKQMFNEGRCTVTFIDAETGAPPSSFELHPVDGECKKFGLLKNY